MPQGNRLAGQVALVTGGGSGIGACTAQALAALGAILYVAGRREDRLRAIVATIEEAGGTANALRADVSDEDQVKTLVRTIMDRQGRLDLAVNNAGAGHSGPLAEVSLADFDRVMKTNAYGTFFTMREEVLAMETSRGGSIVNVASIAALHGAASLSAYTASKHAVAGLTRSAALEVATKGIRINAIAPNTTDTELLDRLPNPIRDNLAEQTAMKRIARPGEIVRGILYLLLDATYSTGMVLTADGGR